MTKRPNAATDAKAETPANDRPPQTPDASPAATEPESPKSAEETAAKAADALQKKRDPETSRWLARALDELDESLMSKQDKKKYEALIATAADKNDMPMSPQPPGEQPPQAPMPPKPMSDKQTEAKDHDNPPMPPTPPADSKGDGPGNGNSGTGPGGPPVPGLKPPKGKAKKKAKSMFFESTDMVMQNFDQEQMDEEVPETKDDPGETLGSGGSAGPAGSHARTGRWRRSNSATPASGVRCHRRLPTT